LQQKIDYFLKKEPLFVSHYYFITGED